MTIAHDILTASADGTEALERALALPHSECEDIQDWESERTWIRFADGSVICAEGARADERTSDEFDAVAERYGSIEVGP